MSRPKASLDGVCDCQRQSHEHEQGRKIASTLLFFSDSHSFLLPCDPTMRASVETETTPPVARVRLEPLTRDNGTTDEFSQSDLVILPPSSHSSALLVLSSL
jgi:hypothetical protein